jgi:hypothetical protein
MVFIFELSINQFKNNEKGLDHHKIVNTGFANNKRWNNENNFSLSSPTRHTDAYNRIPHSAASVVRLKVPKKCTE